jgi:hypothetical protein
MKRISSVAILAALVTVTATSCASTHHSAVPAVAAPVTSAAPLAPVPVTAPVPAPKVLSQQQAAAVYLALVAMPNAATTKLDNLLTGPRANLTVAQLAQTLSAAEDALGRFDTELDAVHWPVYTASDVRLLVDANQALDADWYGVEQDLDADAIPSSLTAGSDRTAATAAAAKVRRS